MIDALGNFSISCNLYTAIRQDLIIAHLTKQCCETRNEVTKRFQETRRDFIQTASFFSQPHPDIKLKTCNMKEF